MSDQSSIPASAGTNRVTPPEPAASAGRSVAVGDRVISWNHDQSVEYGGDSDGGFETLSFGVFSGATPVLKCDPSRVAPADTPIPERDERVRVVKGTRAAMPYGASGVWQLRLPGHEVPSWHRTKRDATATGLRRLAILDWHAGTDTAPAGAAPAGMPAGTVAGMAAGTARVALPTTGYVVLHTSQRDGEPPSECTTFIDAAGRMDDEAAIAHMTGELAELARHAPADVRHTLRLVHRTGDGDRVLLTPDPMRGAGTSLAERPS